MANLARHLEIDPEEALTAANRKFEKRFRSMERDIADAGQLIHDLDIDALEARWQENK